jgi:hypothetical protein
MDTQTLIELCSSHNMSIAEEDLLLIASAAADG